ncbi:MAG: hypothetical protein M1839_004807 [Geoglossum umbratile]|nr:MAG: hypothetical protein M1839_004807 [Geoglossum umbratile]
MAPTTPKGHSLNTPENMYDDTTLTTILGLFPPTGGVGHDNRTTARMTPPPAAKGAPLLPVSPMGTLPATPDSSKYGHEDARRDPFLTLDDLCLHSILTPLSLRDLIRCTGVSRLWRYKLEHLVTPSLIRSHLPFYSPPSSTTVSERLLEFRRLAYRDVSLSRASAAWHLQFPMAALYSAAGNFVVWCKTKNIQLYYEANEISWHLLPQQGEGKLELPVVEPFRRSEVEVVLVNSEGVLLVRCRFESGSTRDPRLELWKDQAYLLPQQTLIWQKDTTQSSRTIPLFLSSTRAYFLSSISTTNPGICESAIQALSLADGQTLYNRRIPDLPFWAYTEGFIAAPNQFKLLCLHNHDFIVEFCGSDSFSIIDGDTGAVLQKICHGGVSSCNVIPVPNAASREFALWGTSLLIEEYSHGGNSSSSRRSIQQIFTQQPDGTFARTNARTAIYDRGASFTVHPFGDYGFCLGIGGLSVLRIVPDKEDRTQKPPTESWMGQQFRVAEAMLVSTPRDGGQMRKCEVGVRWWEKNRPVMPLDQGRIMFDDRAGKDRTLHIVEFGPGW